MMLFGTLVTAMSACFVYHLTEPIMRNTLRLLFVLLSTAVLHPASGTSKNYLAKAVGIQNPGCDEVKITKQPEDFVAANGGTITIPVEVSGPVTKFQWYKDGGEISGQTSAGTSLRRWRPCQ